VKKRIALIFSVAMLVVIITLLLVNVRITAWIEGPRFEDMLSRETSKGLKLKGSYAPLHRVGFFGLRTDSFTGIEGDKTIVQVHAQEISGTFNPLGIFLRRWEIDSIHVKSGSVMLQKTEAAPGAVTKAPSPGWAFFRPDRVYLADVQVEDANILWKLKDQDSGIYDTRLDVTPNGRDFEYDAHDGEFKTPFTPPLKVVHAHLLVRKPRLYCSEFILGNDAEHPDEEIRLSGDAGLQTDRSIRLTIDLSTVDVAPWLPEKFRAHVEGRASGHFDYASSGTGLETGQGTGKIDVAGGVLRGLPQVREFARVTGSPDPGDMALKVCRADVQWKAGAISIENMEIECEGVFRMTGTLTMAADKTLSGQVELGLTDPYLRWLPTARTAIFTETKGAYHFTTVHFSGTAQKPAQDLSARIVHEVGKSPLLALKLFFNQAGEWFDFN
jgi:hypothetical protein